MNARRRRRSGSAQHRKPCQFGLEQFSSPLRLCIGVKEQNLSSLQHFPHVFVDPKWPTHRGHGHTTVTTSSSRKAVLPTGFTRRSTPHVGPTKGRKPEIRSVTMP